MTLMTTSNKGKLLIRDFEGLRLKAYLCAAGVPTIGWGHTKGVRLGQTITEAQAEEMLVEDIAPIERQLNRLGVNFRQSQFDALVSWIFNLGAAAFSHSTLCKRIQEGATDQLVADEMVKWYYAGGRPLVGLMKRRAAEGNLFLGYERYKVVNSKIIKV